MQAAFNVLASRHAIVIGPTPPGTGAITPVPGGVGPMTIACLLANTLKAACMQAALPVPEI